MGSRGADPVLDEAARNATDRFWERILIAGPDECWEWDQSWAHHTHGYGHITIGNRNFRAHRLAFFLYNHYWAPVARRRSPRR